MPVLRLSLPELESLTPDEAECLSRAIRARDYIDRTIEGRDRFNISRMARNGGQVDRGKMNFLDFERSLAKAAQELLFIKPKGGTGWKALSGSTAKVSISQQKQGANGGHKANRRKAKT